MGSHSSDSASTDRNFPATASRPIKRQGFWALLAMYFQRGFCPDIVISQPIPPTLGMDLIKIERELFVFTGPFSQQYQEPDPKGKGK